MNKISCPWRTPVWSRGQEEEIKMQKAVTPNWCLWHKALWRLKGTEATSGMEGGHPRGCPGVSIKINSLALGTVPLEKVGRVKLYWVEKFVEQQLQNSNDWCVEVLGSQENKRHQRCFWKKVSGSCVWSCCRPGVERSWQCTRGTHFRGIRGRWADRTRPDCRQGREAVGRQGKSGRAVQAEHGVEHGPRWIRGVWDSHGEKKGLWVEKILT
jgi:hypothetical protein